MMVLISCIILIFLANFVSPVPIADILQVSKSLIDKWPFEEITFIDLLNDESDFAMESYVYNQPLKTLRFLSTKDMDISSRDLRANSPQGAVIINSVNSTELLEMVSILGLLGTQTWFVPSDTDLSNVKLRLDSNLYLFSKVNGIILLEEVYEIKQGPMIKNYVGTWSSDKGITIEEPDMFERRKNLGNITLLNTLILSKLAPMSLITKTINGVQNIGYMPDLLDQLSIILNFKIKIVLAADGQYGTENADGSFNGMLGVLMRNEADVCSLGLANSIYRSKAADFSISLLEQPLTLIMKKPDEGGVLNIWAYTETFTIAPWIIIILSKIAFIMALVSIGRFDSNKISIESSAGVVFISMLQRDHHYIGTKHSSKAVIFVVCMYSYLIFVYYSTVLTSYMTVLSTPIEIQSFSDVIKLGYHVVTLKSSVMEPMLVNAKPPSPLYDIYHNDMKNRPRAFLPLDDILTELRKNPKTVLYGTPVMTYGKEDIIPLTLPDATKIYLGFALRKNSEFTKLFDYHLLKLDQSGIIRKIYNKWFNQTLNDNHHNGIDETIVLNYDNLVFPSFLLLSGVVLSGVGLLLEIVTKRCGL